MADNALTVWDDGKLSFLRKTGNFVQYFQANQPLNGNGLPLKLMDPTVIAENTVCCEDTDEVPDQAVQNASLTVDYEEGFPTVDGLPIWERLDGEIIDYYKLFKQYREMKYMEGKRVIAKLSISSNIAGKYLNALSKVYHWQLRCKAYDQFKLQEREVLRRNQIESLEAKHSSVATTILDDAMSYLQKHPEQLNPKVALQMVQMGMKAGRLALGLNPDKPGSTTGTNNTSINIQQNSSPSTIDNSQQINVVGAGAGNKEADFTHLQSILHVLDQSGAFQADEAIREEKAKLADQSTGGGEGSPLVIDAEELE